ncbi:MAG: shikimate dehydrogenase [Zoogloeaceae bacterium]|nr:shikimate dehydrogenase [Zoogloeaceae bacterium]
MDRYAVVGHPISHSKSPQIHAAFARQTRQAMTYEALLAPLDGFATTVHAFRHALGRGMNVTVPFKLEAHDIATELTGRARSAGAVNTLVFGPQDTILGDNTDGAGLVRDVTNNLGYPLGDRRVLLLGAGGAARGTILPILGEHPACLVIANRTVARAEALVDQFASSLPAAPVTASPFGSLAGHKFDVVINATAASLTDQAPDLPPELYAPGALAYDMMYGKGDTPFLAAARRDGATGLADGLGMLVEQAAESFWLWRGVRPQTKPVLEALRAGRAP